MNADIDFNLEPLPGYRLIERIGAGGYGEVWRAEAPGGLTKAIKFVFGQQHEKRAVNELRALDHVRSVRHPFLLSLERIEIVDGRLLVVTELADQSVKDRFDHCRRENRRGIPRDELLSYLRDAADALDFMSATHSLQHLDIKPENLLILSGHIKVADFGLVKDVRQSQASLVGGMTPLYAAPEVFRGTPSRQSDLYSLAIVYQEMLTGTLPFAGESAAELTLHHLNDEPDLSPLTAADRFALSRALSKEPQHRYNTCREFVDALLAGPQFAGNADTNENASYSSAYEHCSELPERESQPTEFFEDDQPADWHAGDAHMLVDMPPTEHELVDMPPLDLADADARLVPTLVLGVGGTAGRVLSQLRKSVADRFGDCQGLPAIQFLLIDTDARSVAEVARDEADSLSADERLTLPLRRPQHYRENSHQLLHWLSRRWLYNIPRSLKTEGLRPLGRLALADHARQAGQRIRRSMVQALDASSLKESSEKLGEQFRNDALRVIVVASISGGTGSGMSLDIGYAVRAILRKLNLPHSQIIGLMMHSTSRDARQGELARVNAYSWLTEFNHFTQASNAYPGDLSCGLPAHDTGTSAFDHAYLLNLGANLDVSDFDQATHAVAEYIGLNTLSPASTFFETSRYTDSRGSESDRPHRTKIRSFGIFRQATASAELSDPLAQLVSERVLCDWRTSRQDTDTDVHPSDDAQFIKRLQLDAGGLAANARSLIDLNLGCSANEFVAAWLTEYTRKGSATNASTLAEIDQLFGQQDAAEETIVFRGRRPADLVAPLAEKLRAEVRRWVVKKTETPGERLGGARESLCRLHDHFPRVESELKRVRCAAVDRLVQIRAEATAAAIATSPDSNSAEVTWADEYFQTCLDRVTILGAEHLLGVVEAETKALGDEITNLGREIDQIAGIVSRAANTLSGEIESASAEELQQRQQLAERFGSKLDAYALQVDERLQAEFLDGSGGLIKTIMQGGRPRAQLTAKLHEISRRVVHQLLVRSASGSSGDSANDLSGAVSAATPAALQYGGRRRILAVKPTESTDAPDGKSLSQILGKAVTVVPGRDGNLVICVEADGLSLQHLALDLVERRRDRIEFAGRVHSRTDIEWSSLVNTEPASNVWEQSSEHDGDPQQAMCRTMVI